LSSSPLFPIPTIFQLDNTNNQYFQWGPIVDGLSVVNGVLVSNPTYVADMTITVSLYMNRDIYNPTATPGTLVSAFGTGGQLVMTYTGSSGIYQVTIPSFTATPGGNYVMVLDAPSSPSGYQGHWEKSVNITTRQS